MIVRAPLRSQAVFRLLAVSLVSASLAGSAAATVLTIKRPTLRMPSLPGKPAAPAKTPAELLQTRLGTLQDTIGDARTDKVKAVAIRGIWKSIDKAADILRATDRGTRQAVGEVFRGDTDLEAARKLVDRMLAWVKKKTIDAKVATRMLTHLNSAQQALDAAIKHIPMFWVVVVGTRAYGPYDTRAEAQAKHPEKGALIVTLQSARK